MVKSKNQNGFAHLLLIIMVLVVAAAIFLAATRVFRHHSAATGYHTTNGPAPTIGHGSQLADLGACKGNDLFDSPPVADGTYDSIDSLGHTSSGNGQTGHVFPVDHMYINPKRVSPGDPRSDTLPATILAPADVEIYSVQDTSFSKNGQVFSHDYAIYYAPCKDVTVLIGHVNTLSVDVQKAVDGAKKHCSASFQTSGEGSPTYTPCSYKMSLHVKSGAQIGTAGGAGVTTASFDYGVYDSRIKALPFIDAKYWTDQNKHAVCGLDYYPNGAIKTSLFKKVNNTKLTNGLPDCGTNMWDKAGTIQGNWVLPNTPTGVVPEGQGLAAIHLSSDPSQGSIGWGGTVAPPDQIHYQIKSSGLIDRDPAAVTADGKVYCFESTSAGIAYARHIKLQLIDTNTLKAEYSTGVCDSSQSFQNPTTYGR